MGVVDEGSGQAEVNVKKKTADFWFEESCHLCLIVRQKPMQEENYQVAVEPWYSDTAL